MAMSESEFEVTKQYWYVIFDVYCTPDPSWMKGVSKVEELLDMIEKRLSNETHPYLPPDVELVRRIAKQIPEEQVYKWEDVSSFRDELVGWFYVEKLDGSHEVNYFAGEKSRYQYNWIRKLPFVKYTHEKEYDLQLEYLNVHIKSWSEESAKRTVERRLRAAFHDETIEMEFTH